VDSGGKTRRDIISYGIVGKVKHGYCTPLILVKTALLVKGL
jgi:hypothetical protein